MSERALRRTHFAAASVLVVSTLILAIQFVTPSPVTVTASGGSETTELAAYFTYRDVAVAAIAACSLGVSATVLLIDSASAFGLGSGSERSATSSTAEADESDSDSEARRQQWERTAERLSNKERVVYELVLDADGELAQTEIVDRTDISKATVSRTLDALENKDLIERTRRGLGNVVRLE